MNIDIFRCTNIFPVSNYSVVNVSCDVMFLYCVILFDLQLWYVIFYLHFKHLYQTCSNRSWISDWTPVFWDFKLRSWNSSKASPGESQKNPKNTIEFKVDWIFLDNPFDTSRMWAWNSAYSTEWTLLDHLVPKLHWSKAWFLTPILWVNYWKTTLIQTLCLFTLLNAEQSRFAPSCYGGVLLEKYFCDLSALEGPRGQCYIPLPHKSGLNEAFCYSHPATSAFTPCLSEWSIWLRVNSDQLNHFIFQLWR